MRRNLAQLATQLYDLVVIGGGIYGACVAWDAALRGLRVGLVEKGDFGHATSSNSLRVVHGGLRYLQQGDLARVRRSVHERSAFMRIAPHFVHPLPILIPTYGHGLRGKEIFSLALLINKVISFDHKSSGDLRQSLPQSRLISKEECVQRFPDVDKRCLTGGVIVYDCQVSNSERLVLSFARSAAYKGAEIANYVEAIELLSHGSRVTGVKARDVLSKDEFTIRAKTVVNASGPWMDRVLSRLDGAQATHKLGLSKAFNLLITRELLPEYAVGFYSRRFSKDSDAMLDKGSRLLFVVPWHQRSLIGTAHLPYHADPDTFEVTEAEIRDFMDEINQAYPAASLQLRDISCAYGGLLPAADNSESVVRLVRRHRLYDHRKEDGVEGLISVSGVKFTEARYVAEKTVDLVFTKLGNRAPKSSSAATPLYDARFANLQTFLADETRNRSPQLSKDSLKLLIDNYGSSYPEVLEHARAHVAPSVASALPPILRAEILHAIRDEMAQKLADVVLRRTTLALPGKLTVESLKACAAAMAAELGWDAARVKREVEELRKAPYAPALGAVAA